MTILIFLAVLFVLILVHEWGHYIVAKLTGMRVDEFAIGFPPRLLSWKKGETVYSLNALPIGGFVRIYGEDATQVTKDGGSPDKDRAFSARPKWAQALVLIAGVTMNWIFAWFLLVIIIMMGVPTCITEDKATENSVLYVDSVIAGSPAENALPPQSKIISVSRGDEKLAQLLPSTFSDFVAGSKEEPLLIVYADKTGQEHAVPIVPKVGVIESSPDRAALGVSLSLVETIKQPFVPALKEATIQTYTITKAIVTGLYGLMAGALAGTADFSQVSGPIGIVGYVGDAAAVGFTSLLFFTAIISMNLAVINLLPIPALDGGRLIFVAIETITRREIPPVWAGRVNLVGFALLLLLMIAATTNDVMKLW